MQSFILQPENDLEIGINFQKKSLSKTKLGRKRETETAQKVQSKVAWLLRKLFDESWERSIQL